MTADSFREHLVARAARADIAIASDALEELTRYFQLLCTWNRTINLTALALEPPSDEAIDRLLVEPLTAARVIAASSQRPGLWMDLGSGGGSPAVPMRIALQTGVLTMVESKSRKAAFLRETVRALALRDVTVLNARFDEIEATACADLLTVRAVRVDEEFAELASRLLKNGGLLASFQPSSELVQLSSFEPVAVEALVPGRPSWLHRHRCVPRGTIASSTSTNRPS